MNFIRRYIFSTDHKIIGIQFLMMGLIFFVLGGGLAMMIRWQLAFPGAISEADYNVVLTMHATIMVFFVIIPLLVGAFGNYLIPLKIGANDMAFPFLNGLAFWLALAAGSIMIAGFFLVGNAARAGWTSYAPLSGIVTNGGQPWPVVPKVVVGVALFLMYAYVGFYAVRPIWLGMIVAIGAALITLPGIQYAAFDGQSCWFLSLFVLGFSSIFGAINYLTTIMQMRCPGMTLFRL